jgi:hypothetical protein
MIPTRQAAQARSSNRALQDGRLVVGEEIQIMIEGELVDQQEAAETASS